ncbi:MAG: hypothetical protein F6K35_46400, partial [Okeania sp. SIO2H7]|nr:hypothetical protein [Okeania sp. SIO2H7]
LVLGISTKILALTSADECRNLKSQREEAIAKINSQAEIAIEQLNQTIESDEFKERIEQRKQQLREQINALLEDETRLNEAIESNELPSQVKALLEEAQNNPNAVSEFLEQQAEALPTMLIARLRQRQAELIEQIPLLPDECSS